MYMVANRSRTLYTGVTGRLTGRVIQHKQGLMEGFTSKYRIHRLVYFEVPPMCETPSLARNRSRGGGERRRWL